ncbi:hypothetical protein JTE90_021508 [Oedothorax gibbosus]|uniref:Uncharacterized protein n=1 Tax=Oedothorax gibbosus TaxID=931172 RepID=A0AAV6VRW3_9ARAC|nr:hypothetical protein JTE90_021508 [Oedothorax gibbosus]
MISTNQLLSRLYTSLYDLGYSNLGVPVGFLVWLFRLLNSQLAVQQFLAFGPFQAKIFALPVTGWCYLSNTSTKKKSTPVVLY